MNPTSHERPLNDAEIESLDMRLEALDPDASMAVEELDGFFVALASCPEPIARDEWLPLVLGESERAQALARHETDAEGAALLRLIERHRVAVSAMLHEGEGLRPVMGYDDAGVAHGHAWAVGYARCMALRPDAWGPLEDDEELAEALDPLFRLLAEVERARSEEDGDAPAAEAREDDDEDAADEVEPIADDEREEVLHALFDGVQDVYDFFRTARERAYAPAPVRREADKVGRNDPCPCGSGKKYKQCHGAAPLH